MRTPLHDEHLRLGAQMTDFAGWEMPLIYTGIAEETIAVRKSVGLFDLSHMGEVVLSGPTALESLQYLTTNNASKLEVGQAQYTLLCDENGGVLDDLIVYRTAAESYLMVVNASNTEADFEWIRSHVLDGTTATNESPSTSIIAIQGPAALSVLAQVADFDVESVKRFNIRQEAVAGIRCLVARTGYTGEDGFELLCAWDDAPGLWTSLLEAGKDAGIVPVGLGARDVLRLESAYPLYGHELSRDTNPVEARLMWVVDLGKGDFVGRDAIRAAKDAGPRKVLAGLEAMERCVPRQGYQVQSGETPVGSVTSGTFSPTLGKGIALAYLSPEFAAKGTELSIMIRNRACAVRVVRTPFYKPATAESA